jgi:GNAT superfamily N-acetyltransferase
MEQKPAIIQAEPVLAVTDILKTVDYYHDVLGFTEKWTWGDPPNHGGVTWNGSAALQFSLDPHAATQVRGESVWLRAKHLPILYELHNKNKAKVVGPYVHRPWGFAEYTVQDLNGYYITFSEPSTEKKQSRASAPNIVILSRLPALDDVIRLSQAVGWQASTNSAITTQLKNAVHVVLAEDIETSEVVGCAFLVGDHKTFYYVKDVIVHPDWQGRGIGTMMMKNLMDWLEVNGTESATVGLFTGDQLSSFYKQFGFVQACGMYKQVRRKVNG